MSACFQYTQSIAIEDLGFRFITGQYSGLYYLHILDGTGNQMNHLSNPQGVTIDKEGYMYLYY